MCVLQASKFFNQLNIYSPESNRWTQVVTDNCPDGIAGHGATIVDDSMVVYGGYHGYGNRQVVLQSAIQIHNSHVCMLDSNQCDFVYHFYLYVCCSGDFLVLIVIFVIVAIIIIVNENYIAFTYDCKIEL